MVDKKNVKTKIWVYAVVLFISAFIVLLFAAYSQIKLNQNLVNYRNQVSNQKNENKKIQLSFTNAQEVNDKLSQEIKKLGEEKESLAVNIDKLEEDYVNLQEKSAAQIAEYEKFSAAQAEYYKGNIIASSQALKSIDINLFDLHTRELYNILFIKVSDEAGKQAYEEGYKLYRLGKYSDAAVKFTLSRNLYKTGAYSDDCLYYLALSLYKSGQKASSIDSMKLLIAEFPESSFCKSAKYFIKKHSDIK